MISPIQGYKLEVQVWPPIDQTAQRGSRRLVSLAIDVRCIARGSALAASRTSGCDWVALGPAADFVLNGFLRPEVILSAGNLVPIVGVVLWDEGTAGSVAENAECWVRIAGIHPYAKVNAVTRGQGLMPAASGKAIPLTAAGVLCGVSLTTQAADSLAAVLISPPVNLLQL